MAEWKLQCATSLGQTSGINCAQSCIKPRWICWEQRTCLTSAFRLCQRYRQAIPHTSRPMSEMGIYQQLRVSLNNRRSRVRSFTGMLETKHVPSIQQYPERVRQRRVKGYDDI